MFGYKNLNGIQIAEIDIPNEKSKAIPEMLLHTIRNNANIWNRVICHLICNATRDGKVSADTPEIYNSIFSEREIALHSHPVAKDAMKEINSVKHWLYQRQILGKTKDGERYFTANISVFRLNNSAYDNEDSLIIMCNENATNFSIEFKECIACEASDGIHVVGAMMQYLTQHGTNARTEGGYLFHLRKYRGKFPAGHLNSKDLNLASALQRGWIIRSNDYLYLNGTFCVYEYKQYDMYLVVFTSSEQPEDRQKQPSKETAQPVRNTTRQSFIDKVNELCTKAEIDSVSKVHVEAVLHRIFNHLKNSSPNNLTEENMVNVLHLYIMRGESKDPYLPYVMLLHDLIQNDRDRRTE